MSSSSSNFDESSSFTFNNTKLGAPRYNLEKLSKNSRNTSNTSNKFTIVAITEGRGTDKGTIGMACMDLRHSDLTLCEFFDSRSYTMLKTRLMIVDPLEIIVPEAISEKNNHMKVMLDVIRSSLKNTKITEVQRRFFNDSKGTEIVQQLGAPECCNIDTTVVKTYYCLSAAYAVVKYVEYIQNILFAQKSLSITYEAIDDCCLIDVNSWSNLDLIDIGQRSTKGTDRTLFAILNRCVTVGGSKYLRSCLLQPSANVTLIEERLDLVQEFMLDRVRSLLANLSDPQVLISICVSKSQTFLDNREDSIRSIRSKVTQIVDLKRMLLVVSTMEEVFRVAHSPWIIKNRAKLSDPRLHEICDIIDEKVDDSVLLKKTSGSMAAKNSALFAVREGLNILLDLARKTYTELVDSIKTIGIEEQEKVQGCTLTYSFSRGYHLSLTAKDPLTVQLPPHYIQIMRHRASVTYTTRDLIRYNDRLKQSENEILFKSNILVDQLINEIRQLLPALYHVTEFLTQLDFITALGSYSVATKCVRPKIDTEMMIRNGRHPILDASEPVIPNDTYIVPNSRFIIITGPNMAGKSTYMKQVCLLQILGQLGCFVPAEYASIAPMQRIFSRIGHNDDITRNLSAFALEMNEMAIILPHANENSIIVIDELARSTSTEEGIGMCYAICEELINCKAFVLFATHFLDLSSLELSFPAVQNYHFYVQSTVDSNGKEVLHPSHKLYKGPYKGPLYGFELAELTTFPPTLLENAREMAEQMRSDVYRHQLSNCEDDVIRQKKLAYIAHRILQVLPLIQEDNVDKVGTYLCQLRDRAFEENLL
uniref:DNA mismatch repair proteins mutS family domain-containing protein n=1 Tax=Panagrolaimus sp. ES5 TaxID=591445 RepID=A0AC34GRZ2_9BILA